MRKAVQHSYTSNKTHSKIEYYDIDHKNDFIHNFLFQSNISRNYPVVAYIMKL